VCGFVLLRRWRLVAPFAKRHRAEQVQPQIRHVAAVAFAHLLVADYSSFFELVKRLDAHRAGTRTTGPLSYLESVLKSRVKGAHPAILGPVPWRISTLLNIPFHSVFEL